ncbi:hypothetical protein EIP91_011026 [Steccherinum ochraceum]|uniref:JmjC domain-containing protein n=1 Tax=Steccherinum ochraceum TaxID=92696 RepID=A0A4R0R002_9APHY|nr:hypothetical protein EIP91_011026 [Steccherinum ochraceum]
MEQYTFNTFEKKTQHGGRELGSKNHDISTWSEPARLQREKKRVADKMRKRKQKEERSAPENAVMDDSNTGSEVGSELLMDTLPHDAPSSFGKRKASLSHGDAFLNRRIHARPSFSAAGPSVSASVQRATPRQQLGYSMFDAAPAHFHAHTSHDPGNSSAFPYATPPYSPPDPNFFSERTLHPSNDNLAFSSHYQNEDDLEPLQPLISISPLRAGPPLYSPNPFSEQPADTSSTPPLVLDASCASSGNALYASLSNASASSTSNASAASKVTSAASSSAASSASSTSNASAASEVASAASVAASAASADADASSPDAYASSADATTTTTQASNDFTIWQGKEYCPNAKDITWQGGIKTRGPWCPDSRRKPHNLASHDFKYVSAVAKAAEQAIEGPYYIKWAYDALEDDVKLARRITRCLGQRKVVHLTDNPPDPVTAKLQWTDASFHSNFGIALDREYEAIEAKQRTKSVSTDKKLNINHKVTVPEFMSMLDNDKEVHAILDVPVVQASLPTWVKLADDSHSGYFRDEPLDKYRRSIPKDVQGTQSWFLIHMGRFHTFPHHDSNGLCTLIRILHGCKCWVYLRNPEVDSCQDREALTKALEGYGATDVQFREGLVRFVIYCKPGDLLIQGPGVYHEVYTPLPTVSGGGHFYTLDTMHLTEITLWYSLGVHDHYSRKALAALCRIILRPLDYFTEPYDDPDLHLKRQHERFEWETVEQTAARIPRMEDHNIAINNARLLARYFSLRMTHKLTSDDLEPDFVLEGGLQDPGETIDIASIKSQLNMRKEQPEHPIESLEAREIPSRED